MKAAYIEKFGGPEVLQYGDLPDPVAAPARWWSTSMPPPSTPPTGSFAPANMRAIAHHLRPLAWPQLPLTIELHRTPNHPSWLAPPPSRELLELSRPSATGVDGLLGLLPAAHAVVIAMHSWAHQPLRRLLDLIDIMMVLEPSDRAEAGRLARRWGSHRVWRTTLSAAVSLLEEGSRAFALSTWARHLAEVRERTVLETHLARWAGAGSGLPRTGLRSIGGATIVFTDAVRPRSGESWSDALGRTRLAMSNAFRPQSEHDEMKLRSE